jgi:hypothetical protein
MGKAKVIFVDVKTKKEIVINVEVNKSDNTLNLKIDFGADGAKAHKGTYVGLADMFMNSFKK